MALLSWGNKRRPMRQLVTWLYLANILVRLLCHLPHVGSATIETIASVTVAAESDVSETAEASTVSDGFFIQQLSHDSLDAAEEGHLNASVGVDFEAKKDAFCFSFLENESELVYSCVHFSTADTSWEHNGVAKPPSLPFPHAKTLLFDRIPIEVVCEHFFGMLSLKDIWKLACSSGGSYNITWNALRYRYSVLGPLPLSIPSIIASGVGGYLRALRSLPAALKNDPDLSSEEAAWMVWLVFVLRHSKDLGKGSLACEFLRALCHVAPSLRFFQLPPCTTGVITQILETAVEKRFLYVLELAGKLSVPSDPHLRELLDTAQDERELLGVPGVWWYERSINLNNTYWKIMLLKEDSLKRLILHGGGWLIRRPRPQVSDRLLSEALGFAVNETVTSGSSDGMPPWTEVLRHFFERSRMFCFPRCLSTVANAVYKLGALHDLGPLAAFLRHADFDHRALLEGDWHYILAHLYRKGRVDVISLLFDCGWLSIQWPSQLHSNLFLSTGLLRATLDSSAPLVQLDTFPFIWWIFVNQGDDVALMLFLIRHKRQLDFNYMVQGQTTASLIFHHPRTAFEIKVALLERADIRI